MDYIKNIIILIVVLLLLNEILFSNCDAPKLIPHDFDPAKVNPASL